MSERKKQKREGSLGRVPTVVVGGDDSDRDQTAEIDAENAATWRAIDKVYGKREREADGG